jgi:hypothetical protein
MRWGGYVGRVGEIRNSYKILAGKREEKRSPEDLGVDGNIILKSVGRCGLHSCDSGWARPVADSCEHGNEPSGYVKGEEFLDYLSDY